MKITVLSPHRDDAAFSLSLAIDAWLEQGHRIEVVCCFTKSSYAPLDHDGVAQTAELIARVTASRAEEDRSWANSYGSKVRMIDLALEDAPLRLLCTENEVCDFPVDAHDVSMDDIRAAIENRGVHALVLPLALGTHVDHMTARNAMLRSSLLTLIPVAFYEDLPYAARPGAAEKIAAAAGALQVGLRPGFVTQSLAGEDAVEQKLASARNYPSQISDEVAHDLARFSLRYGGRERLWANSLWIGSSLQFWEDISQEQTV